MVIIIVITIVTTMIIAMIIIIAIAMIIMRPTCCECGEAKFGRRIGCKGGASRNRALMIMMSLMMVIRVMMEKRGN